MASPSPVPERRGSGRGRRGGTARRPARARPRVRRARRPRRRGRRCPSLLRAQLDAGPGVGDGVVEQVAHDPAQLGRVGPDRAGRDLGGVDDRRAGAPGPGRLLEDDRVEVDGAVVDRGCALVGGGEDEQVVDEALHLAGRTEHLAAQQRRRRAAPGRPAPAPGRPAAPPAGPAGRGRRPRPTGVAAARTRRAARASGSSSRPAGRPRRGDRPRPPGVRAGRGRSRRPRPGSGPAGPVPARAPAT